MKKEYEAPVAEKLEFDYSEIVCESADNSKSKQENCEVQTKNKNTCTVTATKNKKC